MKLFEFKKLPEVFGKAKIEYAEGISRPRRDGSTITIPEDGYTDLYPLGNMGKHNQFILTRGDNYWFGGTDENPFLVQLNSAPIKAFLEGNTLREAKFYNMLRWREVGEMERAAKRSYRRQGDIFAVPLNVGWANLCRCFMVAASPIEPVNTNGMQVFGTRHLLRGKKVSGTSNTLKVFGIGTRLIASGVITAPDHADMNLGDRPHALSQTANLFEPEKAD